MSRGSQSRAGAPTSLRLLLAARLVSPARQIVLQATGYLQWTRRSCVTSYSFSCLSATVEGLHRYSAASRVRFRAKEWSFALVRGSTGKYPSLQLIQVVTGVHCCSRNASDVPKGDRAPASLPGRPGKVRGCRARQDQVTELASFFLVLRILSDPALAPV